MSSNLLRRLRKFKALQRIVAGDFAICQTLLRLLSNSTSEHSAAFFISGVSHHFFCTQYNPFRPITCCVLQIKPPEINPLAPLMESEMQSYASASLLLRYFIFQDAHARSGIDGNVRGVFLGGKFIDKTLAALIDLLSDFHPIFDFQAFNP